MVVFTCQHCNASLKRLNVAKHYAHTCRKTPYLTCIDCLKDFHGDDYNSHMTCVTEDERYGDKNFIAKPMAVKQTAWIDVVHMCGKKNENPKFKFIFSRLANYSNVPRKKPKFLNFIKSSLPKISPDLASEVFQIIDEEFMKQKKTESQNQNNKPSVETQTDQKSGEDKDSTGNSEEKKKKKKRNRNSESDTVPTEDADINVPAKESSKKKNKKVKNVDESAQTDLLELEANGFEEAFNIKTKNKKNKQKNGLVDEDSEKLEENENATTEENGIENHEENNETENNEKLSKKEKKKLKKKQKYDAELKNIEESETSKDKELENGDNDQDSTKMSKKKKKRKATISESDPDNGKRQKVEDNDEPENQVEEVEEKLQKGKAKFNWEETIKEVLRKCPDHEMPLKRISKKVLAEYQAVKGERESYEELISKFNKKINKTVGVRVLKDKAKLLSEE